MWEGSIRFSRVLQEQFCPNLNAPNACMYNILSLTVLLLVSGKQHSAQSLHKQLLCPHCVTKSAPPLAVLSHV